MYRYQAFGLNIQAALALPELFPGEEAHGVGKDQTAVTIRFGKINNLPSAAKGASRYVWPAPEGVYLGWDGVGVFLVHDGHEVVVDPSPGIEESLLRLFILGTTLAILLHQRGELVVLHASVVAVSGQAVAFVGDKGAGKSTMAATLYTRGYDLVADDILAVDLRQLRPIAMPGFPFLKLWPDTLASLGFSPESLPRLRPELEKRGYRLNAAGLTRTPVPLKRVFVLNHGSEPGIEPLNSREALFSLMLHWYGARFGVELLRALGLATHFLQCADLATKVSVCRLTRPEDLSALPDVARLVEQNLAYEA